LYKHELWEWDATARPDAKPFNIDAYKLYAAAGVFFLLLLLMLVLLVYVIMSLPMCLHVRACIYVRNPGSQLCVHCASAFDVWMLLQISLARYFNMRGRALLSHFVSTLVTQMEIGPTKF
jgi:hypothetical protein